MKKPITICWLTPAKPYRGLFNELIRVLARELDAPKFEPHLTIGRVEHRQSARALLRQIKAAPIRLRVRGTGFSRKFTKTVFVRFYRAKALENLIVNLGANRQSLRDPHMSLVYKRLPSRVKKELAATIKLPFREVVFDSIKAVRCISPTRTRHDVESWHMVATKRLSG